MDLSLKVVLGALVRRKTCPNWLLVHKQEAASHPASAASRTLQLIRCVTFFSMLATLLRFVATGVP